MGKLLDYRGLVLLADRAARCCMDYVTWFFRDHSCRFGGNNSVYHTVWGAVGCRRTYLRVGCSIPRYVTRQFSSAWILLSFWRACSIDLLQFFSRSGQDDA